MQFLKRFTYHEETGLELPPTGFLVAAATGALVVAAAVGALVTAATGFLVAAATGACAATVSGDLSAAQTFFGEPSTLCVPKWSF